MTGGGGGGGSETQLLIVSVERVGLGWNPFDGSHEMQKSLETTLTS